MNRQSCFAFKIFILLFLFIGNMAFAGIYSTLQTGEVVEEGDYKGYLSAQLINNRLGVTGHLEVPFSINSSLQFGANKGRGFLTIDASWKWIPIPDYEKQPAIGGLFGLSYIRYSSDSSSSGFATYVHPLISKKITFSSGTLIGYTGLLVGVLFREGMDTIYPIRWAVGSEMSFDQLEKWSFILELDLRLRHTYNAISFGVSYTI